MGLDANFWFSVVLGLLLSAPFTYWIAKRRNQSAATAAAEFAEGRPSTIVASIRGDRPLPRNWNLNGGHLTIDESELSWVRHLRKKRVVKIARSDIRVERLRRPGLMEQWWINSSVTVVVASCGGGRVEIAVTPYALAILLPALGAEHLSQQVAARQRFRHNTGGV